MPDRLITHPSDLYVVVCRPALPKDTPDVMALTSRIWEGHDYVPFVWQEWLQDPQGMLAVAEYAGQVPLVCSSCPGWARTIGGSRACASIQTSRGRASPRTCTITPWSTGSAALGGVLRLATSSMRLPVHHLCARTGFHKAGEYQAYTASGLDEPPQRLIPLAEAEVGEALASIRQHPLYELTAGLMNLAWVWANPSAERLAWAAQQVQAFWWTPPAGGARGLLVVGIDEDEDYQGEYLYIKLVSSALEDLPGVLGDFRRLAGQLGCRRAVWLAPQQPEVLAALQAAGFQTDWENAVWVFEKQHPASGISA